MRIHIPNHSKQSIGGGWTFLNTFVKYASRWKMLREQDVALTEYAEADVILISGATMVEREFILKAKAEGKKIVLRIDNIPRNSRNRNTGTSRLYDFAQIADLIIYQSEWAKNYISPFIKKEGPVILNGADREIFNPEGPAKPKDGEPQYLFTQFNRDETKQFHVAWYQYIMTQRQNPKAHLWLAGQFSPELQAYGFDFFMGEKFHNWGIVNSPEEMAEIYRGTEILVLPYFNDACSNTLIEFINCKYHKPHVFNEFTVLENGTGGNLEILNAPLEKLSAENMVQEYLTHISFLF